MPTTSAFSCRRWRTRVRKSDDPLHAVGRQERVAEDRVGLLADAVDAAGPLNQADDRPGEIVVDDDRAVLEVLAFAEDVGGQHDAQFVLPGDLLSRFSLLTGLNRWATLVGSSVSPVTPARAATCRGFELRGEVVHRVGELREDQHLLARDGVW